VFRDIWKLRLTSFRLTASSTVLTHGVVCDVERHPSNTRSESSASAESWLVLLRQDESDEFEEDETTTFIFIFIFIIVVVVVVVVISWCFVSKATTHHEMVEMFRGCRRKGTRVWWFGWIPSMGSSRTVASCS